MQEPEIPCTTPEPTAGVADTHNPTVTAWEKATATLIQNMTSVLNEDEAVTERVLCVRQQLEELASLAVTTKHEVDTVSLKAPAGNPVYPPCFMKLATQVMKLTSDCTVLLNTTETRLSEIRNYVAREVFLYHQQIESTTMTTEETQLTENISAFN